MGEAANDELEGKPNFLNFVEFGAAEIITVVIFLALLFGSLNYFNILRVWEIFPSLNWLPHKTAQEKNSVWKPQISPTPVLVTIKLKCPVQKDYCAKALEDKGQDYSGLIYTLPKDSGLIAAFSGKIETTPTVAERDPKEPLIYLRDSNGNEAIYSYYGTLTVPAGSEVTVGDVIGKIGEGTFPAVGNMGGANFLFSVKQNGKFGQIDLKSLSD